MVDIYGCFEVCLVSGRGISPSPGLRLGHQGFIAEVRQATKSVTGCSTAFLVLKRVVLPAGSFEWPTGAVLTAPARAPVVGSSLHPEHCRVQQTRNQAEHKMHLVPRLKVNPRAGHLQVHCGRQTWRSSPASSSRRTPAGASLRWGESTTL